MSERRQEILALILQCFVKNGLNSTSMRDVAKAAGIEPASLYYFFKNKEEIVTQCAELAIRELSEKIVSRVFSHLHDYAHLAEHLMEEAQEYIPLMRFIVSVRVSPKYGNNITESIQEFSRRYESYVQQMAQKLDCDAEQIRPLVYMMIVSLVNYMIFGEPLLFITQFTPIQKRLGEIVLGQKYEKE